MTKRVSGRELDPNLIPIVADLTPQQIRQAGVNTVGYCLRNGLSHDEMADLLGALGLVPTASPASVDANGVTIYPASQNARRERNRGYKRNARRKDAAS